MILLFSIGKTKNIEDSLIDEYFIGIDFLKAKMKIIILQF